MARLLKRYGANNVKVLHTYDRAEADKPEFSEVLLKRAASGSVVADIGGSSIRIKGR